MHNLSTFSLYKSIRKSIKRKNMSLPCFYSVIPK